MSDLARRSDAAELMDDAAIGRDEFCQCLRHLEIVNRCTFAYRPTLAWLDELARRGSRGEEPLAILDVGFGHGDMLRRIAAWARRRGVAVRLAGVDLNPWSAEAARRATPAELNIRYVTGDVFAWPAAEPFDVVISSLFTHHLPDADVARFLAWMEARAARGWFVNDLHRHWLPMRVIAVATRLARANRLVRHDAPVSVARAFTRDDWRRSIAAAGLDPADVAVTWHFPFRYGVGRIK